METLVLFVVVVFLSFANGSNDNFKAVATLYGSSTLSYRTALWLATGAQILGSVASIFLAGALLKVFTGSGLVPQETVGSSSFLIAVGLGAAGAVMIATRFGLPISTTHGLVGGLAGAGVFFAAQSFHWSSLGGKYFLPLLISPLLAVAGAALIYPIARAIRLWCGIDEVTCVCIGRNVEHVSMTSSGEVVLARTGLALTVDQRNQCEQRYSGSLCGVSAPTIVDTCHVISGSALGFARGLNDTPKIMALLVAGAVSGMDQRVSLIVIAIAMALGGIIAARRVAHTLGKRITEMNRGQGFVANFVGSVLVIGASILGSPVSTTHVSTGAIFGIGLWTGKARWKVVTEIILAWLATLPAAALIAWLVAFIFHL